MIALTVLKMMTKQEFASLIQVYGADFSRWPEDMRAGAKSLLAAGDPDVVSAYGREKALDDVLDSDNTIPPVSIALEEKLLASAPSSAGVSHPPHIRFAGWLRQVTAPRWVSAGVISAALISGASVGYASGLADENRAAADSLLAYSVSENIGFLSDVQSELIEEEAE